MAGGSWMAGGSGRSNGGAFSGVGSPLVQPEGVSGLMIGPTVGGGKEYGVTGTLGVAAPCVLRLLCAKTTDDRANVARTIAAPMIKIARRLRVHWVATTIH